jgi:hypothetical protein
VAHMLLGFDPFNACSLSSIRQAAADAARLALACSRPELKSRLSVLLLYQLDRLVDSDPVRGTPNASGTRRRRHPPAVGGGSVFRVGPSTVDRMRTAVIKLRLLPQRSGAEARWPVSAALRRSVVVPSFDRVSLGSPALGRRSALQRMDGAKAPLGGPTRRSSVAARVTATWLILPVVICLSQRLSHACLSTDLYTVKLRMAH